MVVAEWRRFECPPSSRCASEDMWSDVVTKSARSFPDFRGAFLARREKDETRWEGVQPNRRERKLTGATRRE